MLESFSYGGIYLSALGLGLFLSSLVRKRHAFWIILGISLFVMSQGVAFLTGFYTSFERAGELILLFASLSLLVFLISLRLVLFIPFFMVIVSLFFIYWGSSGIYLQEKGIYPVQIDCYPSTVQGRSYHFRFADGRESTLSGAGNFLVMERVSWNRFYPLLPGPIFPVGLLPYGIDDLKEDEAFLDLTHIKTPLLPRPGLQKDYFLMGPIDDDLFYTLWLYKDPNENLSLRSVGPFSFNSESAEF